MLTYNDVYQAQMRHEELIADAARRRAENTPVTFQFNVIANAIRAIKAAFASNTRTARISRTSARHTLAAE